MTKSRNIVRKRPREDEFWARVRKSDRCWEWQGSTDGHGYGTVTRKLFSETPMKAHRLAWLLARGPIPDGVFVLHRCDNPPCVRPDHLFLGTAADNSHDMFAKGRGRPGRVWGEGHPMVRLTEAQVRDILARSDEPRELVAAEYGVARSTITMIVTRKTWRHLHKQAA